MSSTPILDNKDPGAPSVFEPTALLREARRQKGLPIVEVPAISFVALDIPGRRSLRPRGLAITLNSTNLRLLTKPPASSDAQWARHSPSWSQRSYCLRLSHPDQSNFSRADLFHR